MALNQQTISLGHGNSEQHPELAALMDRGRELQIPKATLERALTLSLVSSSITYDIYSSRHNPKLIHSPNLRFYCLIISGEIF